MQNFVTGVATLLSEFTGTAMSCELGMWYVHGRGMYTSHRNLHLPSARALLRARRKTGVGDDARGILGHEKCQYGLCYKLQSIGVLQMLPAKYEMSTLYFAVCKETTRIHQKQLKVAPHAALLVVTLTLVRRHSLTKDAAKPSVLVSFKPHLPPFPGHESMPRIFLR
jgi:hypothetical protein